MKFNVLLSNITGLTFCIILLTACSAFQPTLTSRVDPSQADAKISELLILENVSYRVNDVYTREKLEIGSSPLGPSVMELQDESMHFCQVEFTVINHTDEQLVISIDSFQFIGSDGNTYEPLGQLSDDNLDPNDTRDFTLTFVVKRGMEIGGVIKINDLTSDATGVIALRQ